MKFFLISNMYPTIESPGYGSFVKNIADILSKLGIKETFSAVIRGRGKSKIEKIRKYVKFYMDILKSYWKQYDFIYLHFPNQAVPILYPLLLFHKRHLIVNLHGEDLIYSSKGYGKKLGKLMEQMCRNYADAIVVPSEYFKQVLISRNVIASDKIIVSPSGGINPEIFYPESEIESDTEPLHLGYVGRMEKDKGIIEFLNTCKILKDNGLDFYATAIGYGSFYEYAKQFIKQNQLSNIELIPGLPQDRLGEYYRNYDLLIFSSSRRSESLGLTGIEAMACGTPVIGSNIGGIATYIIPGYNGWLTPIGDVNKIVEHILDYQKLSSNKKMTLRNNAAKTGERYYATLVGEELKNNIISILANSQSKNVRKGSNSKATL